MGEDSCSSSDNLRANWTPIMDQYFIELMLDQVRRGNKTGSLFSKQAWAEMIALFNSNFGFRHDIDTLKNRYKRFRKLYNEVKILNQSGFSWDVKKEMVVDDDHAWDDVKVHLDMQTDRTKVVPYYDELCIICGHAVADGRYSLSCFDVDYDNEAKTLDVPNATKNDHTKIDWSQTMDEHFIQLMLKQVHKGNKVGRTFKRKAWIHMVTEFNTRFGFQYGKVVLQNRYNVLRRQYCTIKFLLGQRGFSWDEKHHLVIADDRAWNSIVKARRDFRKCRNKTMPYYTDMCIICENETTCEGENISSPKLSSENETPGRHSGGASMPVVKENMMDEADKKASVHRNDKKLADQRKRRQSDVAQTFPKTKKVQRVNKGMSREMTVAITTLRKKDSESSMSTKNVVDTLQTMPDMDEDLLLDACDFLEDERRARMFLALDDTLRKKWLFRKLRP